MGRRRHPRAAQDDLFSTAPAQFVLDRLDGHPWPPQGSFPVNRASIRVGDVLHDDLVRSEGPIVVAGYSSLAHLVDVIADWSAESTGERFRVVLGSEPFTGHMRLLGAARTVFSAEVADYWLQRGMSLKMSAKLLAAIDAARNGQVEARFVHGSARLHAKVYVGDSAASVGSSNFTEPGLRSQIEVNARFLAGEERARYDQLRAVAENIWAVGEAWTEELVLLLEGLLQVVSWEEALARATSDLLDGAWATKYVAAADTLVELWPTQRQGIAQALWVIDNVGSVLVADATGSGKTRMGAHLLKAVLDRMWTTGRSAGDLPVLVCPPGVMTYWNNEVFKTGLALRAYSHGGLSGGHSVDEEDEATVQQAVGAATVLAVDEAHNFLSAGSHRTKRLQANRAEHVLLFTATPISRGASDLLSLVGLLGPDNFSEPTLEALRRLERSRARDLTPDELDLVRTEIQRFAIRRTKAQLNAEVDRGPEQYRAGTTGRLCRYPQHDPRVYPTGETGADVEAAQEVAGAAAELRGIGLLEQKLSVPGGLRTRYSPTQWLEFRLAAVKGLAAYQVRSAMRSSRAAALEHVAGTITARASFDAPALRRKPTDGAIARLERRTQPVVDLDAEIPPWLRDASAWAEAKAEELAVYRRIESALLRLSVSRERAKADLLTRLSEHNALVLAFDQHPITLDVLASLIPPGPAKVIIATGTTKNRKTLTSIFSPTSAAKAIALCSEAMNEGLNLQGASVIVHLDLPTTLRVAEQRVGRVDRMNSPHDVIEAYWPDDGPAFATRANELLLGRLNESSTLLGSNLEVPDLAGLTEDRVVRVREQIQEMEHVEAPDWDGLHDALEPVRLLVFGDERLVSEATYERYRSVTSTVLSRVAPLSTPSSWAFLSIKTPSDVPRWMFLENGEATTDLPGITALLRQHLASNPPSHPLDATAQSTLAGFLDLAAAAEDQLLPRKLRRALEQLEAVTLHQSRVSTDLDIVRRWRAIHAVALGRHEEGPANRRLVAELWVQHVAPRLDAHRHGSRQRYVLLRDIDKDLRESPPPLEDLEALLAELTAVPDVSERIVACILGVAGGGGDGRPTS